MPRPLPRLNSAAYRLPAALPPAEGHGAGPCFVYAIGLDPLAARALYADLRADMPGLIIRRRRTLPRPVAGGPAAPAPRLVLLDLNLPSLGAEVATARSTWGDEVVVVGVGRDQPITLIWWGAERPERVELGPGFLRPYLRAARITADGRGAAIAR